MKVLYENPNFLIFDEPTNDLDLPTLSVLENFLLNFQGCLIIVSHDRYFMDRIVDRVLAFEGEGNIKNFTGNFSEYRASLAKAEADKQPKVEVKTQSEPQPQLKSNTKKRLSYKEQRELEQIEKDLPILEAKREEILSQLNNETDYEKISKLSTELEAVSEELELAELRWLELQE